MLYKPLHFRLEELVCPHVFYRFGEQCWQFLEEKNLRNIDWLRGYYNKAVFINNYWMPQFQGSDYIKELIRRIQAGEPIFEDQMPEKPVGFDSQSGYRCPLCSLVNEDHTKKGIIYASAHERAAANDFHVEGMLAQEVRDDLVKNQIKVPFPFRLEDKVSWVHMDSCDTGQKVSLF